MWCFFLPFNWKKHLLRNLSTSLSETASLFLALNSSPSASHFQAIHARVIKTNLYFHGFLGDQVVSGYAKFGLSSDALNLFDEIPSKDLVSWNSIISSFSQSGYSILSWDVFRLMISRTNLRPNGVTLISVLPACGNLQLLDEGRCVHGYVEKTGFSSDVKVLNSLINMYGKCGLVSLACTLFQTMEVKTLVSWNSIIGIHTQNGLEECVIDLFKMMRRTEIKPDRVTLVSVLQGCANLAAVTQGRAIHGYIVGCGLASDIPITTALINFYAKSGNLDSSREIFAEMNGPDTIAWSAIIASYAMHGQGREAIDVFECMVDNGILPDHVTFTHLLSACSHSGLVIEGKKYFKVMKEVYGIKARMDHYSCMVDLLGRSSLLDEAHKLIENMSIEPNSGVWGALLGACRVHRNIELGKQAAERLFALDPLDPRNYIILANMYATERMWVEASKVRALMKHRGLRKTPGCSFIEHENMVIRFVVGDRLSPASEMLYKQLEDLTIKMFELGYMPKTEL